MAPDGYRYPQAGEEAHRDNWKMLQFFGSCPTHTHIPVWKVGDVLACEISGIIFLPKFVGVGDLCLGKEGRKKLEIAWL